MTPEIISATAGVLLSLAFSYIPGLNTAYDKLSTTSKKLVMAGLLAIAAVGTAAWTCSSNESDSFGMCLSGFDWRSVVTAFVLALMANQATHRISPQTGDSSTGDVRKLGMPEVPPRFPADTTLPPKTF